jgi:hypothetical protein
MIRIVIVIVIYPLKVEFFATGDCVELGGSCLD